MGGPAVIQLEQEAETEAQVTPIATPTPGHDAIDNEELVGDVSIGSDFSSDLFTPGRMKPRLSRREKRQARQRYAAAQQEAEDLGQIPPHALEISAEELQQMQKETTHWWLSTRQLMEVPVPQEWASSDGTGFCTGDGNRQDRTLSC